MVTEIFIGALPGTEYTIKPLHRGISMTFKSDETREEQTVALSLPEHFALWEELQGDRTCIYVGDFKSYLPLYRICFHHNLEFHNAVMDALVNKGGWRS